MAQRTPEPRACLTVPQVHRHIHTSCGTFGQDRPPKFLFQELQLKRLSDVFVTGKMRLDEAHFSLKSALEDAVMDQAPSSIQPLSFSLLLLAHLQAYHRTHVRALRRLLVSREVFLHFHPSCDNFRKTYLCDCLLFVGLSVRCHYL